MRLSTTPATPMSAQTDSRPARDVLVRSGLPAMARAQVLGTDLALTSYEGAMDWMDEVVRRRERACVTAAAVHLVMVAREDPETRDAVDRSLAVPDGVPLVWALRALGHPEASRVYGPDLMAHYCARSARTGTTMFLYGGRSDAALEDLTKALLRRYPGLRIVGGWSPPFRALTYAERDEVAARINATGADVVWVGTGQPKQEKWMAEMRERLDAPVLAGVGAAFDFHAGIVPQAPRWMQRRGLEWTYRLAREPRRLWRRYAKYNPRFVAAFARQYAAHRARR
jgi:N-acetylglucosaminyldiphosphoundecaprenol N-acetyl-beta-D-mannosaminyltransferase